jgi:multicomponent Na+:H+ antiporter subunit D
MPVTAFAFWVAAFSIAGVPLFNGFVSKGMILAASEQTSIWLWVLLEIASFGTFVSFLKLGYFAFLRPGDTQATDPPLLMQAGMLGAAALCILIGIYPQLLYAILPYPTTYAAYDTAHVLSAVVVLGAALLFFFSIGKKMLEPHDTHLKDIDIVYMAACRGITTFAIGLRSLFTRIYDSATFCARMLFVAGGYAMGMENRDPNWNIAMFASVLVALITIFILGVGL